MSDDEDDFGDVYETKPAVSSSAEASLPSESDIKATTTITSLQDTEEDDLYDELYGDADTPAETSVAEKAHTATEVVTSECQTPHKDVHAPTEEPTPVTSHEVQQEVVPAQAPLPPPAQPAFNDDDDDGFNIIMDKEVGYEVQEEDDDDGFNIVMDSDVPAAEQDPDDFNIQLDTDPMFTPVSEPSPAIPGLAPSPGAAQAFGSPMTPAPNSGRKNVYVRPGAASLAPRPTLTRPSPTTPGIFGSGFFSPGSPLTPDSPVLDEKTAAEGDEATTGSAATAPRPSPLGAPSTSLGRTGAASKPQAAALEMPPPFVPEGPWGSIERFDEAGRRKLPGGKGGWKFIPPEEYREFLALGHGGALRRRLCCCPTTTHQGGLNGTLPEARGKVSPCGLNGTLPEARGNVSPCGLNLRSA
ncbi:hypothetical protein CYMTET_28051 [Cymbomonas tetramitiformis]|uniref:Uncharacterized protein n=1 Tax=Cymbomonas tetramitiformis TaxID=36881 RepID=A0AAE0FP67_9CHLO|nr:hypothetical protein CYMTET_28051 [Cymbomonas tetramitiformis]